MRDIRTEIPAEAKKWFCDFDKAVESLMPLAEHVGSNDTRMDSLLCDYEKLAEEAAQAFKVLVGMDEEELDENSDLDLIFHDRMKDTDAPILKNTKELLKKLREIRKDNEDMLITSTVYSKKDPITGADIVTPVQNVYCKHVYDKDSIKEYIEHNRRKRRLCQCPHQACPNKRKLLIEDMKDFPEFWNLVQ
ncbi:hypothetical protein AB6A40_000650 [Gnathostoma spinigerum]|uniref:E3 SUMO-protein ligase NSE2 n=1 Tax=Gnathostoma spinigerum TaxID=75299 RepID=A0ABD6E3R7_9BILA